MKKIIGIVLVLLLTAGWVYAGGLDTTKKAGEYTLNVKMDKVPSVGRNDIEIGVQDAKGADVTDAVVVVEYSMPAMPGMPAMNYKAKTAAAGSKYKSSLEFSMAGPWAVNVKVTKAAKTQSAKLTVDVR